MSAMATPWVSTGISSGTRPAVMIGLPIVTAGLVPDQIPALVHGVAVADLVLAA